MGNTLCSIAEVARSTIKIIQQQGSKYQKDTGCTNEKRLRFESDIANLLSAQMFYSPSTGHPAHNAV